ncbi:hypothetical protein [Egbenema bharatensis]|uniref:hypothetical protein n=1 Tax=Egbenema bharatensis TaxID=3463334 RepID=UPI003A8C8624
MTREFDRSRFWQRWFFAGLLAGMFAGLILFVILPILILATVQGGVGIGFESLFYLLLPILILMVLGGIYGIGQGAAHYFSLNPHIPRMGRSLRANFIGTLVGVVVTGVLLLGLIMAGFGDFLQSLGLSFGLSLIIQVFIVGGFGGIAQAIAERSILGSTTEAGYFRWIVPLALLGHVSGGLVGIVGSLIVSPFLNQLTG